MIDPKFRSNFAAKERKDRRELDSGGAPKDQKHPAGEETEPIAHESIELSVFFAIFRG